MQFFKKIYSKNQQQNFATIHYWTKFETLLLRLTQFTNADISCLLRGRECHFNHLISDLTNSSAISYFDIIQQTTITNHQIGHLAMQIIIDICVETGGIIGHHQRCNRCITQLWFSTVVAKRSNKFLRRFVQQYDVFFYCDEYWWDCGLLKLQMFEWDWGRWMTKTINFWVQNYFR